MVPVINSVLRISNLQYGNYFDKTYDNMHTRLMVRPWDNWKGINPSGIGADFNPDPPIFAARFSQMQNYNHILAIANEDGMIALQNTFVTNSTNEDIALEGFRGHFNAVFDLAWMPYHLKLISASGDHTSRLWNVTESKLINDREFRGHSRSVKQVTFRKNDCSVFATGGRDGQIIIWDLRSSASEGIIHKVDNRISNAHIGNVPTTPSTRRRGPRSATPKPSNTSNCNSSVTGLVFQDENTLISCGPGDGVIKVWDLRRTYSTLKKEPIAKHNLYYAGSSTLKGFTNLIVDETGTKLYASCMDSNIYSYNVKAYSKDPMTYTGLKINSFYIKSCLSPDGNYLLSGSSDEKAYIWNIKNSTPLATLSGHNYEVTCVAWSHHQNNLDGGNNTIVTCSDDAFHKIWRIGPEEVPDDEKILLRGHAVVCDDYFKKQRLPLKPKSTYLESTPRSLKRFIEQSETTPTSTGTSIKKHAIPPSVFSSSRKRNFFQMNGDNPESIVGDNKRPNLETKGRRLFSSMESSSHVLENEICQFEGSSRSLKTILEELESPNSKNFHNLSPSPVKRQLNIMQSPENVRLKFSSSLTTNSQVTSINSPTTNLPNFVVDGDAPHLSLMSPIKKVKKENIDWLTKMRKQKLLSLNGNLEKSTNQESFDSSMENLLKSIENKSEVPEKNEIQKRNETTILNFFSINPEKTET